MTEDLPIYKVVQGDCRDVMAEWPENCIDVVIFSPPYWGLRNYGEETVSVWDGWKGQLGLELDYRMYVKHLVEVGGCVKRVLKPSGSWYLNMGDTYAGSGDAGRDWQTGSRANELKWKQGSRGEIKSKCKMLMPYRVALALIDDGWICRNDITWQKPNPMPSSVKDRLNTTTEQIFHFVQRRKYHYDLDAIRIPHKTDECWGEAHKKGSDAPTALDKRGFVGGGPSLHEKSHHQGGKNPGDVIEKATKPFPDAHFCVYPIELCELPIKSSCPEKVCVECGKPYGKIVEIVGETVTDAMRRAGCDADGGYGGRAIKDYAGAKAQNPSDSKRRILKSMGEVREAKGWRKTCACCTDKTKPGIVLDPMCGTGSTLVMAQKLGRRWIGIDISEKYCEIARKRILRECSHRLEEFA